MPDVWATAVLSSCFFTAITMKGSGLSLPVLVAAVVSHAAGSEEDPGDFLHL